MVLRHSEDMSNLLQDWRQVDVEAMIMQPEACNTNMELFRECKYMYFQYTVKLVPQVAVNQVLLYVHKSIP